MTKKILNERINCDFIKKDVILVKENSFIPDGNSKTSAGNRLLNIRCSDMSDCKNRELCKYLNIKRS